MVQRGVFQKSVPVNIQAAADRARKLMGLDDDEAEEPGEMPDAPNDYGKIGISDSIRIAGKNIVFLEMCLDGAMKLKNLKEAATYRKQLNEAMDLLRALEKDRGKIDLESRTMLPKEEIRAAMMELHANIQKQIRQHLRHAFMDAPDHLASRERWCSFVDGIVDLACSALIKSDFAA